MLSSFVTPLAVVLLLGMVFAALPATPAPTLRLSADEAPAPREILPGPIGDTTRSAPGADGRSRGGIDCTYGLACPIIQQPAK